MKRIKFSIVCLCLLLVTSLTGCGASNQNSPVTLTIWHVYGDQSNSPLNDLITQYNDTEGKEKGISVVVTHVSNTNNIDKAVLSAYGNEPGAPKLPDIFVSYPKTVATLDDTQLLVDYHDYFTEAELGRFVQPFLDEGYFGDKLLILPVVKSTSMLFVNKTLFDRFAAETGASLEDLATWEGLFETACLYVLDIKNLTLKNLALKNDGFGICHGQNSSKKMAKKSKAVWLQHFINAHVQSPNRAPIS